MEPALDKDSIYLKLLEQGIPWQSSGVTRGRGMGQGLYSAHTSTLAVVLDV